MTNQQKKWQQSFVATSFGRTAYVEQGAGPVALFLHGLPLSGYEWRDVIGDLAATRRCIAIDQMGLGHTEVSAGADLSYAGQARMLAEFLSALGIESIDLVGNDTGGGVSQLFLSLFPHKLRTLTLTNCEVHDLWPNELLTGFYAGVAAGAVPDLFKAMLQDLDLARAQLGALVYENFDTFSTATVQTYLGPIVASEERIQLFQRLCNWQPCREQMVEIAPQLKKSKVPAQLIWGMADGVFDAPGSLAWLESNLGGLQKVTRIPEGKLFFPEERPHVVSALLAEFWRANSQ